jgi:hypothetical protein
MKKALIAAASFLAIGLPAVAAPASSADNVCLQHRYIEGWGSHGDHAIIVDDRFGRKYLISLAGYCADLNFSMALGIRSTIGNADSCVERGDRIVMRGGGATGMNTCWVTKVERYTPEMEKADRAAREAKQQSEQPQPTQQPPPPPQPTN